MKTLPPLCSRVQWMQETRTFPSRSFQWCVHHTLALSLSCYVQFVLCSTFYACAVCVHVQCMYMCSVCTCAVYVHVQCVYMCSVCTCAVCVHVQCVYMCSVCTCAVCVHVQCVYMCSLCKTVFLYSFPVAPPHTRSHTPLSCVQLDCFHPSLLMHELMAKVMWNCMLTPAMQKDRTFNARADFICPTNSTLLYTY